MPLEPTAVHNTYWRFATERQNVYFARLLNTPSPWTPDPIISTYKFTNAYRAADRVSQFLIRSVIYQHTVPVTPEDVLFRILLFKLFNKIETWQLLEANVGSISFRTYKFVKYDQVLTRAIQSGSAIYSAAYIMPNGGVFGHAKKHRNHLALLELMMRSSLPRQIARARSMAQAFEMLRAYPSIGDFLAYQFVTDINYSELTDFSESEFVVPGPGAIDGIRKSFSHTGDLNDADVIRVVTDAQEHEFERRQLNFTNLFGRRLQYIDCQNLFCEVDKYARVAHPQAVGRSGRTRIKQKYARTGPLPEPWFPPKWKINDRIASWLNGEPNGAQRLPTGCT